MIKLMGNTSKEQLEKLRLELSNKFLKIQKVLIVNENLLTVKKDGDNRVPEIG